MTKVEMRKHILAAIAPIQQETMAALHLPEMGGKRAAFIVSNQQN